MGRALSRNAKRLTVVASLFATAACASLGAYHAEGQWRDGNGTIAKEPARVLEFTRVPDSATEARVVEIAEYFRKKFDQEAVARQIIPARVIMYTP